VDNAKAWLAFVTILFVLLHIILSFVISQKIKVIHCKKMR